MVKYPKHMQITVIGSTDKKGGAATISWSLKKELEKIGHLFFFFVSDKTTQDKNVFVIKRNPFIKLISKIFPTENLYRSNWILNTKEYRGSDIVHCHNLHGSFFDITSLEKISKEKPVVWTLHDEWAITPHCGFTFEGTEMKNGFYVCPNKDIYPKISWHNEAFLMRQKRAVYQRSKLHIVVPCQWLKSRVEKSALRNHPISLIYYGIDHHLFSKKDKRGCRNELGLPADKKIIFFVADGGKSNPFKGWSYAEEVIKKLENRSDILFVCGGNSNPTQENKQGNILYLGEIKDPVLMSKYYSASDILLYSSVADNFPLIILEAMSCGLPIVSFDTGGIKEALAHKKNGYLAKYKDTKDLLFGIKYLLELEPSLLEKMSTDSSTKIAENFNLEKMVRAHENLYNKLIQ